MCVWERVEVCVRTRICASIQAHACDSVCRAALPSASEVHSSREGERELGMKSEKERESIRKRGIMGVE